MLTEANPSEGVGAPAATAGLNRSAPAFCELPNMLFEAMAIAGRLLVGTNLFRKSPRPDPAGATGCLLFASSSAAALDAEKLNSPPPAFHRIL